MFPFVPDTFVHEVPEFVVRIIRADPVPYVSNAASAHVASVGWQTMERTVVPGDPEDYIHRIGRTARAVAVVPSSQDYELGPADSLHRGEHADGPRIGLLRLELPNHANQQGVVTDAVLVADPAPGPCQVSGLEPALGFMAQGENRLPTAGILQLRCHCVRHGDYERDRRVIIEHW